MGYRFVSDLNQAEYDQFIENSSMVCFTQNYDWYQAKPEWGHFHCGLYRDKELVAVCLILVKNIFKGIKVLYSPRGYVIDFADKALLTEMTKQIKRFAKSQKAYMVKIDPYFCISDDSFKEGEAVEHNFSENYAVKHQNLTALGYKRKRLDLNNYQTIQPRVHVVVPLCDTNSDIIDSDTLRRKCKRVKPYVGQYQSRRGISFEITDDIDRAGDLAELLKETGEKHDALMRNEEYIKGFMSALKGRAFLVFATIDLDHYLDFLKDDEYATPEKVAEAETMRVEHGQKMILSAALMTLPQNKKGIRVSEYVYAGNRLHLTKFNASAALVFEICKFSIEQGCHYCDLGGVQMNYEDPLLIFKKRFNSRLFEFAGEYDLPTSWLYYPIELFYPLLLKIYQKITLKKAIKHE